MKQKFFLSLAGLVLSVLSVTAQADEKIVVNVGTIDNIHIANDMNIVLIPGNNNDRSMSMSAEASKSIAVQLSGNSLSLSALKHPSKEKQVVYLHVGNLKTLTVDNNSQVKTIGTLDAPRLELFIDGEATVHLKTNGEIKAHSLGDAEIHIKDLSVVPLAKR